MINYKSALELWNDLIITHEGASQVKRSKIDLLCYLYEKFYMFDNESIDEMLTHFTKITNGLCYLGDEIDNDQKVRKVIRALLKAWEVKTTTLKKLNDHEKMNFSGLIGNLKIHKIEMRVCEEENLKRKSPIAFKAIPPIAKED